MDEATLAAEKRLLMVYVLAALGEASGPRSAEEVTRLVNGWRGPGSDLPQRTIRRHLIELESRGLVARSVGDGGALWSIVPH